MLERESLGTGWQVSLHPHGVGRFFMVAFLGFWLCGWAAGEYFAGVTLVAGLRDLLAPELDLPWLPHMNGRMPSNPWPVVAFLAFWLTFWTMGGLFALSEVLRAFIGVDHVRWDHEGLEVERRAGPFVSRSRQKWSDVNELLYRTRGSIVGHTRRGLWRLASLGDEDDRRTLVAWLLEAWREARGGEYEVRTTAGTAPQGWVVETSEEGRPMLVADPGPRRIGAVVLIAITIGLGAAAVGVGANARGLAPWAGASVLSLLGLLALAGAAWLGLGCVELRPAAGSLRRVRRFMGREWTRELSPARLALTSERDSDGDDRWTLIATGPGGKISLGSDLHVPGSARHVGLWLASHMGVELEGQPELGELRRVS